MQKLSYYIVIFAFFFSCKSIHYCPDRGVVFYEFGKRSHYYSDSADNFGIDLYHGFNFFDGKNRINEKELPVEIRKAINVLGWKVKFILVDRLSPQVSVLIRQEKNERNRKNEAVPAFLTEADTNTLETSAGAVYKASQNINSDSFVYKIICFSYRHKWLRSKVDSPSIEFAKGCVESIKAGWREPDQIREDVENERPLLANTSDCFWHSKNNYLYPIRIINTPANRTRDNQYYEASTTFNSFIGNYHKSLVQRDSLEPLKIQSRSSESLDGLQIANAIDAILDSALHHRVLMINEAHNQPLNRRFFSTLLEPLNKIGYHSIFLETLAPDDSSINDRKFPIQISGYYTSEPHFGNCVRHALKLGFKLYAYDNDSSDNTREILQAEKIAAFLKRFPNEKVIVYCGYDHIDESSKDSMMAFHLKRMTGIDPLTIDQTKLVERGNPVFEKSLFRFLDSALKFKVPIAVERFELKSVPADLREHDISISLPRSTFRSDMVPEWQFQLGSQKLNIHLDGARYDGALLQIFSSDELKSYAYWDLIPITNLVLTAQNDFDYFLEPGRYEILVTDVYRNVLYQKEIVL